MSTVLEIKQAIENLPDNEAAELREWLENWLEDQLEVTPEFMASIEKGEAQIRAGLGRVVKYAPDSLGDTHSRA